MGSPLSIVDSQPLPAQPSGRSAGGLQIVESKPLEAPKPNEPESFWQGVGKNLNPIPLLKTIYDAADDAQTEHPVASMLLGPQTTAYELGKKVLPGLIQAQKEQWDKATQAYSEGRYSEAAGHLLATALPGIGPAAAKAGETIGSGNIAGGLGEAAGLIAPFVAGPAVKSAAQAAGIPEALEGSAEKQYSSALNATTRGNKARSADITPQLIDRRVRGSVQSIQQRAASALQDVGHQLADAYDDLPPGASIPLKDVQAKIAQAAQDAFTVPTKTGPVSASPVADAGLNHAAEINNRLLAVSDLEPTTGARTISVDTARRLRQFYDSVAAQAGRYNGTALADQSAAAAHGQAADAIRSQLANDFPDIAKINQEYSFWKDVNQVTSDTLLRRQGQATSPLSARIAQGAGTGAGAVIGGKTGAVLGGIVGNQVQKLFNSGAWKTTSAVLKDRLADALASGNQSAVGFYAKKAMQASGALSAAPAAALPMAASNDQPSPPLTQ
jgi:hypothetical protein